MAREIKTKPLLSPMKAFQKIMENSERRLFDDGGFDYTTEELRGGWRYSIFFDDGQVAGPYASRDCWPKDGGMITVVYNSDEDSDWKLNWVEEF